jgi:NAD(P)-dependent dehydrogenase (short-subunit alcohol dehydrogenase family)
VFDRARPLAGRVALITGSTRNIGRAVALTFARAGADIVVHGRQDAEALADVVAEVEACGAAALGVLADVADDGAVERLVAAAVARFGTVDIAVSNVGRRRRQPFAEIGLDDWRAILGTNLDALFHLDRRVLPLMVERGWGHILHMSGHDGFAGHAGNRAHNVTAKAGMHGLTKAIAREYGRHGITANTVVPGMIETERDLAQYPRLEAHMEEVRAGNCVKRIGTPQDVAEACLFLAGDGASFITGTALHVNGGEFML